MVLSTAQFSAASHYFLLKPEQPVIISTLCSDRNVEKFTEYTKDFNNHTTQPAAFNPFSLPSTQTPLITQQVFLDMMWVQITGCSTWETKAELYTGRRLEPFLSLRFENVTFNCFYERNWQVKFLNRWYVNQERMYKHRPGCLNSWCHLQGMAVDQVGEEVTLRRWAPVRGLLMLPC